MEKKIQHRNIAIICFFITLFIAMGIIIGIIFSIKRDSSNYTCTTISQVALYNENKEQVGFSVTEEVTIKKRNGNMCEINVPAIMLLYQTYAKQSGNNGLQPKIINCYGKVNQIIVKFEENEKIDIPLLSFDQKNCKFIYTDTQKKFIINIIYLLDETLNETVI